MRQERSFPWQTLFSLQEVPSFPQEMRLFPRPQPFFQQQVLSPSQRRLSFPQQVRLSPQPELFFSQQIPSLLQRVPSFLQSARSLSQQKWLFPPQTLLFPQPERQPSLLPVSFSQNLPFFVPYPNLPFTYSESLRSFSLPPMDLEVMQAERAARKRAVFWVHTCVSPFLLSYHIGRGNALYEL